MSLTIDQIRSITVGAAYLEQTEKGIRFHRFTQEQEAFYRDERSETAPEWYINRCAINAGIRLRFQTDSPVLTLSAQFTAYTSTQLYALEIYRDGKLLGMFRNYDPATLPPFYYKFEAPQERHTQTFDLGEGEKEIELFLPWSAGTLLEELSLADGAALIPIKRDRKLLCFGDSITQGVCARVPSARYASLLADGLHMDEYNKAIGGERFIPKLATFKEDYTPDLITVAYGTNDFTKVDFALFKQNCFGFFQNLRQTYPQVPICAITPIWRKHRDRPEFGAFSLVEDTIRAACAEQNIHVIRGYDLVPHQETLMADQVLHPNDEGFAIYAENLLKEINALNL